MRFNLDQILKRAQITYPELRSKTMADFRYVCGTQSSAIIASPNGLNTAIVQDFPAAAILFAVVLGVSLDGQAGTVAHRNQLSCVAVGCSYSTGDQIITKNGGRAIASSVFGEFGDMFPGRELLMKGSSTLTWECENLVTTAIHVTFAHHMLLDRSASR